ncbi:MAG: AraC family transcriptional regulator [Bacteroidota bacterium]
MQTTSLPEDLDGGSNAPVQVFHYTSTHNLQRGKIHLSRHTISFLRHGTKEVLGQSQRISIDPQHFLIMQSGRCLMTESISPDQQLYQSILLFFTDEILHSVIQKNAVKTAESRPLAVFRYDAYIQHFVESLVQISRLEARFQEKMLPLKCTEILSYLLQRDGPEVLKSLRHRLDGTERHFINVVEHNRLNKLSLQELAFLCNMSVSTFKRSFQKHYHASPSKWFQENRLEHAATRLRRHQLRAIEVFEEAGYESLSNFVQAFRRKYGMTPKVWQQQK